AGFLRRHLTLRQAVPIIQGGRYRGAPRTRKRRRAGRAHGATSKLASSIIISLDGMGGDHGPPVTVGGVREYLKRHGGEGVRFLLHGDEKALAAEVKKAGVGEVCEIRATDKVIAMDEKPAQAMRRGKGSSMWNAVEAVKTGE